MASFQVLFIDFFHIFLTLYLQEIDPTTSHRFLSVSVFSFCFSKTDFVWEQIPFLSGTQYFKHHCTVSCWGQMNYRELSLRFAQWPSLLLWIANMSQTLKSKEYQDRPPRPLGSGYCGAWHNFFSINHVVFPMSHYSWCVTCFQDSQRDNESVVLRGWSIGCDLS